MSSRISATAPAPIAWSTGSGASCSSNPEARAGRDGRLRLAFERRGGRTILTERRFALPLQALECLDLDGTGDAALMLLNPTGGVVGGDVLETSVTMGPGSHVCLSTPSATRVYRTAGPPAVQRFVAEVGEGARLEYLPGHLIPSPGARLRQTTEVRLAARAMLLLADSWAVGRIARGERWRFDELDLCLSIEDDHGLLFRDRSLLCSGARLDRLGQAEGFAYVATFAALGPLSGSWDALATDLMELIESNGLACRFGASTLPRGGLVGRLLCPSARGLGQGVLSLWARCRDRLCGLGPLDLRKL